MGLPYEPGEQPRGGTYLAGGAPDFSGAFETTMDWILQPSGMTIAQIKAHPGGMRVPDPLPVGFKKYEKKGFPTPSGKMEFASSLLEKHSHLPGIDPLPLYREPRLSAEASPEVAKDYPLILGTGTRLPMFIHSRTFRLPWTRCLRPDASVDINPADATRLRESCRETVVELSTPNGAIEVSANVTELAHAGAVHMYHDYPEADVNALLPGDYLDPISGFPGYKALLCAVRKVAPAATEAEGGRR